MESFTIGIAEESGVDRLSEGVRVGLPFAPGVLAEPYAVALLSSGGESLDAQYHPLALWRDGSIRWLLASFQIDLAAGCETTVEVRPAPPDARMAPTPSLATNEGPRIQVDTGSIRAVVGGESADSFVVEDREGNQLLSAAPHLRITTGDGVLHRADAPDTLELEENGPVCASAFVAGPMRAGAGDSPFRYETRLFFWRGQASVSAEHTFVNVGTEEIVEIDEATIELCADSPFEGTVDCGTAGGVASHVAGSLDDVGIVTVDQRCYFWQEVCRNEDGTPDYYVLDADFGYAVTAGGNEVARGGKAPGWVLG